MNSSSAVIEMTPHGMQRCSQRAVSPRKIEIVVNYIKPIRSGNYYVFAVGKKDITRLLDKGIINKQEADKLPFLIMVTDYTRTQLVTAYYASQKTFKKKTKQRVFI
jgi:hypothetical protein